MVRAALLAMVTVVILAGALATMQRRLIYYPDGNQVPPAASVIPGARDVTLTTSDGLELGAWFVPARDPNRNVAVLVANGNGGSRVSRAPLAQALARRGFSVLLFDYRGYGGNPGTPTEKGLATDVRAALRYLTAHTHAPLIYIGDSLGTAVVTELAAEHPPAALVLRSPFVSLAEVGRVHYPYLPVRMLLVDRFPLVEHLSRVQVPTLVVYGTGDDVVPAEQSRAVADAAPGPTDVVEIPGAAHNDPALLYGERVLDAITRLADQATQRGS